DDSPSPPCPVAPGAEPPAPTTTGTGTPGVTATPVTHRTRPAPPPAPVEPALPPAPPPPTIRTSTSVTPAGGTNSSSPTAVKTSQATAHLSACDRDAGVNVPGVHREVVPGVHLVGGDRAGADEVAVGGRVPQGHVRVGLLRGDVLPGGV